MPYITQLDRSYFDGAIDELIIRIKDQKATPGELNYIITRLIVDGMDPHGYAQLNAVIGALECAKMELYRRMVAPYEDKKIEENGDVYT